MDLYPIFKLLHIFAALAWVGGGLTLLISTIISMRQKGELATIRAAGNGVNLGKYWFMPASLLTLIFGLAMTATAGLWGELWIWIALAGFATTFATGALVFEPTSRTMAEAMAEGRETDAVVIGRLLLNVMKFDYTMMLLVVADMVLKPTLTDVAVVAVMGAVLLTGIGVFLIAPGRRAGDEPRMA